MKSVLISINPKWVEKIASGEKTIEVRKSAPKETPFKCYIYCSKNNANEIVLLKNYKNRFIFGDYRNADGHFYTIANGKVIGEFVCDKVDEYNFHEGLTEFNSMGLPSRIYGSYLIFADDYKAMCLSYDEVKNYGKEKTLYGWHIADLKIYDKPKELSGFGRKCDYASEIHCRDCLILGDLDSCCGVMCKPLTRPPQSWQYVEELENGQKTAD